MRPGSFAITLAALTFFAAGCAHQQTSHQAGTREEYLTGSYIPQNVDRHGPVTNGKNDVRIIDRADIDKSGGSDVQQSLRELGATH